MTSEATTGDKTSQATGWLQYLFGGAPSAADAVVNDAESSCKIETTDAAVADDDSGVVRYEELNCAKVSATVVDEMLNGGFYDDTLRLLEAIDGLEPSRISFLDKDDEKGLLIDGVRSGWHCRYVEWAERMLYSGWFFVEHDVASGAPLEPCLHYPARNTNHQRDDDQVACVQYWPSMGAWCCYWDQDGTGDDETLLHVSFCNADWDEGDLVTFYFENGAVVRREDSYGGGKHTLLVHYCANGLVRKVAWSGSELLAHIAKPGDRAPKLSELFEWARDDSDMIHALH